MMKANFDSMYSCTACETSYNDCSKPFPCHLLVAGSFSGRGERERDGHLGGRGRRGLVQNRPSPDFRSREVGISGIGVD